MNFLVVDDKPNSSNSVQVLTKDNNPAVEEAAAARQCEMAHLPRLANKNLGTSQIYAASLSMKEVIRKAKKYHQDRSIPVLIEGETGTGKEVIARIIHYGDDTYKDTPFIAINCAAITPSLFESELFGYEAGAFTGGLQRGQKGKIDIADSGTLFLDEVGEIPLELQGKLLRVIQEKEFYRVGGLKKITTDVRIICATNINLERAMIDGSFRKDLYYRLRVGHLVLPPLRERQEDIVPLVKIFLREFSQKKGKRFEKINDKAQEVLLTYAWPGNVRELQNAIEWATFMYDDTELKPEHLDILSDNQIMDYANQTTAIMNEIDPENFVLPAHGFDLEEFNDRIILKAIEMHNGNKSAAARYLGITRRALGIRLERLQKKQFSRFKM